MLGYRVVYEQGSHNWCAYAPKLPGCIATGATKALTQQNMASAIKAHIAGMHEDGIPIPRMDTEPARRRRAGVRVAARQSQRPEKGY